VKYLLDTCVLSESRLKYANDGLKKWLLFTPGEALFISVISIGEIRYGIERLAEGQRKSQLAAWLEYELTPWFYGRVLSLDIDTLNCWGSMRARSRTLPAIDSLLAATAIQHRLTLVTRNVKDFGGITELQIINPWEA
jgi:predicted nucleic acid-binding protein